MGVLNQNTCKQNASVNKDSTLEVVNTRCLVQAQLIADFYRKKIEAVTCEEWLNWALKFAVPFWDAWDQWIQNQDTIKAILYKRDL